MEQGSRTGVGGRGAVPAHLREVLVPIIVASRIAGREPAGLYMAAREGRLKAIPFPAGTDKLTWQVKLGDLAEYLRAPLPAEWLTAVEGWLAWQPGEEVQRVA